MRDNRLAIDLGTRIFRNLERTWGKRVMGKRRLVVQKEELENRKARFRGGLYGNSRRNPERKLRGRGGKWSKEKRRRVSVQVCGL